MAWRIREWNERYEPPIRGQARKGARGLEWFRAKVVGRHWGPGWRMVRDLCGRPGDLTGYISPFTVLGVFVKCVELASEADTSIRDGTIYDDRGVPADLSWITRHSGGDEQSLLAALPILAHRDLAWMEEYDPAAKGRRGTQLRATESNRVETKTKTKTKTKTERETKTKRAQEDLSQQNESKAGKPGDSESPVGGTSFSDSLRLRQVTLLRLAEVFPGQRSERQARSDRTTFAAIVSQLVNSAEDAEELLLAAKKCRAGKRPVATFVDSAKRRGYRPSSSGG